MKESIYNFHINIGDRHFVYNTKYNGIIEVDTPNLLELESDKQVLESQGYIVRKDLDESKLLIKETNDRIISDFFRLDITVLLTEKCNFSCVYCYQERHPHDMDIETADKLIEYIEKAVDIKKYKEIRVCYFGGEPLLNLEVLYHIHEQLIKLANNRNIRYIPSITTNGSLLTEDLLTKLDFNAIQLTIEGTKETHEKLRKSTLYTFNDLISNIKLALEKSKSNVKIRINLCKENQYEVKEMADTILSKFPDNSDRISFNLGYMEKHYDTNEFNSLSHSEYVRTYLDSVKSLVDLGKELILPSSLVSPCPFITGNAVCLSPTLQPAYCSGKIDNSRIHFLDKGLFTQRIPYTFPEECRKCNVLPLCMSGCDLIRENGDKACIPEKYILHDYISLFIKKNFI